MPRPPSPPIKLARARANCRRRPRRCACRGSRWCRSPDPRSSSPVGLLNSNPWPSARGLSTMNSETPRCVFDRSGSVRARSIRTSARPANVHHVFTPLMPIAAVVRVRRRRFTFTPATSEPKSGSVTATATISSPDAMRGSQPLLLLLGAALDEARARISGRVMSDPGHAERAARQLLGGDDHPEVVGLAAGGEPAVLLGHREPEAADLGQPGDDVLGDVGVVAVDVLGDRPDLVLGEAPEGVLHHLEVGVEVARPLLAGQAARKGGSR